MSKRFRIQDAEPGMILAYPVINLTGRVVLAEGTVLTEKIINRLQNWQIVAIDILDTDELPSVPITEKTTTSSSEKPTISKLQENFGTSYAENIKEFGAIFEQVRYMTVIPITEMQKMAEKSFRKLSLQPCAVSLLYTAAADESRIVQHSLNVAVIAGALGHWLGLPIKSLHDLILSALLHDIGKTKAPLELINKKLYQLTTKEFEIIQRHTIEGYKLLNKKSYQLPFSVLAGVLQHHEWINGSGYPLKLTSEKIHLFAKIILVADVYETLTSTDFATRLNPFSAIGVMLEQSFHILDPKIANVFLTNTKSQLIGNNIRLSDGQVAAVISIGRDLAERPVVQTPAGKFINLESARHLYIEDVISI
jgi:putative nucleotidyltransferase with HDIG domain